MKGYDRLIAALAAVALLAAGTAQAALAGAVLLALAVDAHHLTT